MNTLSFSSLTKVIIGLTILLPTTSLTVFAQDDSAFKTSVLADGTSVDQITVNALPDNLREVSSFRSALTITAPSPGANAVLLDVPAFDQSFGAFATAGAMIAGYYDRNGYDLMYTGPTNNGVMPMDNTVWGRYQINGEDLGQCPLIASRNGLDGRGTRGHVDDYWIKAGSAGPDPYDANNWDEHAPDCVGDYMKSSKWFGSVFKDYNKDGSAIYNLRTDGSPTTAAWLEATTRNLYDAGYGLKLFYESRGYTVPTMYNQYILGAPGTTSGLGFTLAQYKAEIDAGRPVIIHLQLTPGLDVYHVMVGIGYDASAPSTIYVNDGINHATHSMTWGGTYNSTFDHIAVTVVTLTPTTPPAVEDFSWPMFVPSITGSGIR